MPGFRLCPKCGIGVPMDQPICGCGYDVDPTLGDSGVILSANRAKWLMLLVLFSSFGLLCAWMLLTPGVRQEVLEDESIWMVTLVLYLGGLVVLCGWIASVLLPVVIDPSRLSLRITERGFRFTAISGFPN